jgi:hypothetical protein
LKRIILIVVMFFVLFTGCGKNKADNKANNANNTKLTTGSSTPGTGVGGVVTPNIKEDTAIYTGEKISKENYEKVPFMAIIENLKAARPQAGTSEADIVFETMAEGGIPRFMALFQSKRPGTIGPIRSDRAYFNSLAETFKLPFAHCGGSTEALNQIKSKGLESLNEMKFGKYYWRDKKKKAPHNLFTSSDKLTKLINSKNYNIEPSFNMNFDSTYWDKITDKANQIVLRFSNYYTTTYDYKDGIYYKTMNNVKVPDKNNGEQLYAKNIIIQTTKISPIIGDPKERVNVKLIGSGAGYVISNGSYVKMLWKKSREDSQIIITDENNQEIKLSPGNTWWEIIDDNSKITIK